MSKHEDALNKIADTILGLDEASVTALWEKYKTRMEHFSFSREWEKAVVIFSVINAIRVKNAIFNEQMLAKQGKAPEPEPEPATAPSPAPAPASPRMPKKASQKPNLRLVK